MSVSTLLVHGPKTCQSMEAKDRLRATSQRLEAQGTQSPEVFKVLSMDRSRAVSKACRVAALVAGSRFSPRIYLGVKAKCSPLNNPCLSNCHL